MSPAEAPSADTTAPVPTELVAAFDRDGFVVVPGLISGAELDALGPVVDAAVELRKGADTRSLEEKSRYEQSFQQCINLWEDTPEIRPLTFHPRIAAAAAALLGVEAVRLWHDQALYKEPGGRETDPHQDQPYWPIAETDDGDRLDPASTARPRQRRHGLRRRLAPGRAAPVRQHLLRRARGPAGRPGAGRRPSPASSRCHAGRWPSTTV